MMSIAKDFSQTEVWGVTKYGFTSASSTPLYTLILASLERVTGVRDWWPLVLALFSSVLALVAADFWLRPLSRWLRLAGLLAVIFLVPLYVVAMTGMEHCLHICLSLVFLLFAVKALEKAQPDVRLLWLAPAMVLIRFESLFLIGICAAFFILRRCFRFGFSLLLAAVAAVGLYALFSLAHGGAWLPNPVLMKGQLGGPGGLLHSLFTFFARPLGLLLTVPHVGLLFLALLVLFFTCFKSSLWDSRRLALLIVMLAFLAHLEFARLGWVYRYEAYLLAMGIVTFFAAIPLIEVRQAYSWFVLVAAALTLMAMTDRCLKATQNIVTASFNVYEQQYQMARFIHEYYPTAGVAANDIGWITYASNIRLLDLTGLANRRIFDAKRRGDYTTSVMEAEVNRIKPKIAIVYDSWFGKHRKVQWGGPALSKGWTRVARWHISDNLFLGGSTVSFYAVKPSGVSYLRASLRAFRPSLPHSVTVLKN